MTGTHRDGQWSRRLAPLLVGMGALIIIYGVGQGRLIIALAGVIVLIVGIAAVVRIARLRQTSEDRE